MRKYNLSIKLDDNVPKLISNAVSPHVEMLNETPTSHFKSNNELKIISEIHTGSVTQVQSIKKVVELNLSAIEFAENKSHQDFVNTNLKKKDIYSSSEKLKHRREDVPQETDERTKVNDSIVQELQLLRECDNEELAK